MTFGQLRTFVEVSRHGSVRAAAAWLSVTEPSVSAGVSALERDLGVKLFEREGRGIRITPAGRELADYAAQILGLADLASRRVKETAGQMGRLHLAAITTAGEYVLPPILKVFRQKHPLVQVRMEVGNRAWVFERLMSHEADMAIGGRAPEGRGVVGEPVLDNNLVVLAAPDNPFTSKRSIEPRELSGETWLVRESGSGTRQTTEEFFAENDISPRSIMTLGSNGAVKQAAAAGLGLTVLSVHAVTAELASGMLSRLRVKGTPLQRSWYALYLERQAPAGAAGAFLDLLRSPQSRVAVEKWLGLGPSQMASGPAGQKA